MAEQRPAFRFRLPWLLPSEPAATPPSRPAVPTQPVTRPPTNQTPIPPIPTPRPPTSTQTPIPPTPTPTPLFRPSGLPPTQSPSPPPPPPPPPLLQAPTLRDSQSTAIRNPDNKTPEPINAMQTTTQASSPATPPPRPPFRPPGAATGQPTSSQQPRTESQSSSPSPVGTQSRISSQPASPTQSRVRSKPASPSQVGTQSQGSSNPPPSQSRFSSQPASPSQSRAPSKPTSPSQSRVSSQPASPSRVPTQSRDPSTPPSPSQGIIQSRTASQTSSLSRAQPSQTGSTRSPSPLASQPTGKITPIPSSPAKTSISIPPIEDSVTQLPSSITLQQIGQEAPRPSFSEPQAPIFEKIESKPEGSPLTSHDSQPKTQDTSNTLSSSYDPHNQTSIETSTQPNVLEAKEVPAKTQKSDSTLADSAFLDDKPKVIKETEAKKLNGMSEYEETKEKMVTELLTNMPNSEPQTKEQPTSAIQPEQKQPEKQLRTKKLDTSISKVQENRSIFHQMDKSPVGESRQRPVASNGAQASLHNEIKEDISKFVQKMTTSHSKNPMDEKSLSIITIAGDNRGASMHLGSEATKREGVIHIRRGYKINPDESGDTTTDGEGSSRGRRPYDSTTKEDKARKAYVNSNIQGVNNSIVFNSSVSHRNPGVHLAFTSYRTDPIKSNNKTESLETHKAEVGITPAQKLTYEPVIRRRCLRGLFLEPSDSDDDNPQKPRRHGCRYSCGEKSKDRKIDVL